MADSTQAEQIPWGPWREGKQTNLSVVALGLLQRLRVAVQARVPVPHFRSPAGSRVAALSCSVARESSPLPSRLGPRSQLLACGPTLPSTGPKSESAPMGPCAPLPSLCTSSRACSAQVSSGPSPSELRGPWPHIHDFSHFPFKAVVKFELCASLWAMSP